MSRYIDLWNQHVANNADGVSHTPGSIGAIVADLNPVINWPGWIMLAGWMLLKIKKANKLKPRRRKRRGQRSSMSVSFSTLTVPFNEHHTAAELSGQLAGAGIDHCVAASTNSAFHIVVSSAQKKWATDVAGRYIAGNPINPWAGPGATKPRSLTAYIGR